MAAPSCPAPRAEVFDEVDRLIGRVADAHFQCGCWPNGGNGPSYDPLVQAAAAAERALTDYIRGLEQEVAALRAQLRGKTRARLRPRPDAERGVIGVLPSLERDAEPEPHLTQPARLGGTHP